MAAILSITAIGTMAGATSTAQGKSEVPKQKTLIQRFDALKTEQERLLSMVEGKTVSCKSAEKAIVYYRNEVWKHEDILGEPRTKTNHPEKLKNACPYKRWQAKRWVARYHEYHQLVQKVESDRPSAICYVFGRYCGQALTVARCESGWSYSIHAQNGQYLGMFQMGSGERKKYGHSNTALGQAKAAYRYFVATGRDWSPWSCRP